MSFRLEHTCYESQLCDVDIFSPSQYMLQMIGHDICGFDNRFLSEDLGCLLTQTLNWSICFCTYHACTQIMTHMSSRRQTQFPSAGQFKSFKYRTLFLYNFHHDDLYKQSAELKCVFAWIHSISASYSCSVWTKELPRFTHLVGAYNIYLSDSLVMYVVCGELSCKIWMLIFFVSSNPFEHVSI